MGSCSLFAIAAVCVAASPFDAAPIEDLDVWVDGGEMLVPAPK